MSLNFVFPLPSITHGCIATHWGDPNDPSVSDQSSLVDGSLSATAMWSFDDGALSDDAVLGIHDLEQIADQTLDALRNQAIALEDHDFIVHACRAFMRFLQFTCESSAKEVKHAALTRIAERAESANLKATLRKALQSVDDANGDMAAVIANAAACYATRLLLDATASPSSTSTWKVALDAGLGQVIKGRIELRLEGSILPLQIADGVLQLSLPPAPPAATMIDHTVAGAILPAAVVRLFGAGPSGLQLVDDQGASTAVVLTAEPITDATADSTKKGLAAQYLVFVDANCRITNQHCFNVVDLRLHRGWNVVCSEADCMVGTEWRAKPYTPDSLRVYRSPAGGWSPETLIIL